VLAKKLTVVILCILTLVGFLTILLSSLTQIACEGQPINNNAPATEQQQIMGDRLVSQSFVAAQDHMDRIELFLLTYGRKNTHDVNLRLLEVEDDIHPLQGIDVFHTTFNAATVSDQTWHTFTFPPIPDSAGKTYLISLDSPNSVDGDAITVGGIERNSYLPGTAYFDSAPVVADMAFRSCYQMTIMERLQVLSAQITAFRPALWGEIWFYGIIFLVYILLLAGFFIKLIGWVLSRHLSIKELIQKLSVSTISSSRYALTKNRLLLLLLVLTLIRGLIYASVTPPWWQSHDEDFHFAQVKLLAEQWLPGPAEEPDWLPEMSETFSSYPLSQWSRSTEVSRNLDQYSSYKRDSLTYYLYAGLDFFLIDQSILFQFFAVRLVSVLITCITILFAFLGARHTFPKSLMAQLLTAWFILFNPSFMIISSAINDGNLTVLLCTIIFYLIVVEISGQRFGWRSAVALALTSLALLSKVTALFLIIVWAVLFIILAIKVGKKAWGWLLATGGVLLVTLLFLPQYFQGRLTSFWRDLKSGVDTEALAYAFSFEYFRDLFASFWIILGHAVYWLDQNWYLLLAVLTLSAAIGLIIYFIQLLRQRKIVGINTQQKIILLSLLFFSASAMMVFAHAIQDYELRAGRLARFIFPAIVPLSILLVTGWRTLLPVNWRNVGFLFIAGVLFLFDTMVWLTYALPWYYPFWP